MGKTRDPHPKLEGTLDTAVNKLQEISENVHGEICDIRNEENIEQVVKNTNDKFGGIDGLIINASALCLNNTIRQTSKEINLMTDVNIKGSFLMGKYAMPYIQNSLHPHILTISPPIDMLYNDEWWKNHIYYSMSKFNMSLMAKFWNSEFTHIGVNTLWPRTTINTAPVRNILGGEEMINISRKTAVIPSLAHGNLNQRSFISINNISSFFDHILKNPDVLEKQEIYNLCDNEYISLNELLSVSSKGKIFSLPMVVSKLFFKIPILKNILIKIFGNFVIENKKLTREMGVKLETTKDSLSKIYK